ncbi:MAG: peptidoglycan-binding protein LysM [Pseudomonadota bacterium]
MGFFDFVRNAGEKLFNPQASAGAAPTAAAAAPSQADVAALNNKASTAILNYIKQQNLKSDKVSVSFDGATSTVTVSGEVPDQTTREKIVLCCGNVGSVERVNDQMTVAVQGEEAAFYTVKSGDNLSKISKQFYGDANQYNKIFEANKPMLTDPDKIYPGQTLRIPPAP